jgi:hypothetical protein
MHYFAKWKDDVWNDIRNIEINWRQVAQDSDG